MIHQAKHFDQESVPSVDNILDIPNDWNAVPFTDIQVVSERLNCPDDTEPVFERLWFGTTIGCFLDNRKQKLTVNGKCGTDEDGNQVGVYTYAWPAIYQQNFL